ncbi:MAG: AsmA family protein, partial [Ferruginibacter sp.]
MKWLFRILAKTLKISGIAIALVLLLLYLIPLLFPGQIAASVKNWANSNLDAQLNFSKTKLSFFTHFPAFTVSLHDFTMTGSSPFKRDTLIAAKKISFGIDLQSLFFESRTRINKIFLNNARVHIQVNENGAANYNVYRPQPSTTGTNTSDISSASLKLEKIVIKQSDFIYDDASLDLFIKAKGLNYKGAGDLSKAIFDLKSHIDVDTLDLTFAHEPYLQHKKINADLITQINTNSLAFIFEKNDLRINKLPVQFKGTFDFLSNGYAMDFTANSTKSNLYDLFSALPPQYVKWLDETEVKGETDLALTLKGQFIASENIHPNLVFQLNIRDGYIQHQSAPYPLSNLLLRINTQLPALNIDSLKVDMDTLSFNVEKDYLKASLHTLGFSSMQ